MLGQASQDVPRTGGSRKPFPPQTTTLPFMLGWNLDAAVKYAYAGGRGMFSPSPPQGNGTFSICEHFQRLLFPVFQSSLGEPGGSMNP